MKLIKNLQWLLLGISVLVFCSCSQSNAGTDKTTVINVEKQESLKLTDEIPVAGNSKVEADLEKAKKAAKAAFVIITENNLIDLEKAKQIANGAAKICKNASVLQLNRDDASNGALVKDWGLAGIPVPFIVVVSPLGIPSGGLPATDATAESIAALVPSPKLDQVYQGVNSGKNAIVLFTKASTANKSQASINCRDAVKQLANEAVLIEVDMDDAKEFTFMSNFKVDRNSKEPVTLIINKSGQIAATYTKTPETSKIVATTKAPVKSGCCPGGSSAGCSPKK